MGVGLLANLCLQMRNVLNKKLMGPTAAAAAAAAGGASSSALEAKQPLEPAEAEESARAEVRAQPAPCAP